jgi:glycosyltransferase involved in cell wall biosynthesis
VTSIPILILSYNDLRSLRLCLRAIVNRTRRPYELIVVDNASTEPRLKRYLRWLACLTRIRVHVNRRNLWVLGLNAPLREALANRAADAIFAVSDCDIIVPPVRDGACWLERMERSLASHACIGKLGLALDTGYIATRPAFSKTLEVERFFMAGPRIGDTVIAGVDTTMALYRRDLFVMTEPEFFPGHQSLHRPHYYCCRTRYELQAKHLSWRGYTDRASSDVVAKLVCMALLGTEVGAAQRVIAPLETRLFYAVVRPMARLFWGLQVALRQGLYLARRFPRRTNEVQHARRGP